MRHLFHAHPDVENIIVRHSTILFSCRSFARQQESGRSFCAEIINTIVVNLIIMKKLVLAVLGLLFLSGIVSAYQINIYAPETLPLGKPLIVTGTTTFGIGTPIGVVLYYQLTTATEIQRKITYVQSDRTFRVVFDTTTLKKGMYKVEVPATGQGDSVTMRLVELIDRTDEIQISSPMDQLSTGTLSIAGTLKGNQNSGVQIEVTGPDGQRVFGPQYISTNVYGSFSISVPVTQRGAYEVSFTDAKGFVGTKIFSVVGGQQVTSPPTPVETIQTQVEVLSAHAKASRDNPAYFEVKTGSYKVNIYTSSNIDWMMEYIDDRGLLHTVLDRNQANPEEIVVQGKGRTIYVKLYPFKYSDNSIVFLYAENAQSVRVSPTVPAPFAAGQVPVTSETQESPLPAALGIASLLVLVLGIRK
jgi:hypothetical protein